MHTPGKARADVFYIKDFELDEEEWDESNTPKDKEYCDI